VTANENSIEPGEGVALRINGALLAVGRRPALEALERPLRGVALSDSPVLVRAGDPEGPHIAERLHALGRRAALPRRDCLSPDAVRPLLGAVGEGSEVAAEALGSWTLHGVAGWPTAVQVDLERVLARLDEARLHGRLKHERIPRVVVVQRPGERVDNLHPDLARRLSFFDVSAGPHTEKRRTR